MNSIVGIVPAYCPDFKLLETVRAVVAHDFLRHIVVIDDGSGDTYGEIFDELRTIEGVTVLHLAVNSGMGGAIKYGLQYALYRFRDCSGFVAFDADGQHAPGDIKKITERFSEFPDRTVLGVRDFYSSEVAIPFRSRFGNRMTELVFYAFTGIRLADTQTGLRCYPRAVAKKITQILRNRYEFQLEALLLAAENNELEQVKIKTIYEDNNRRSHFNPVLDSVRIYLVFARFIISSLICSVVDYIAFAITYLISNNVLTSLILSRILSVSLNFIINRSKVFNAHRNLLKQLVGFFALATFLFLGSFSGISLTQKYFNWSPLFSKIVVEIVLFVLSFIIQRLWIFSRKNN